MTNERAAKIILDLINAGEAEYRDFSVEEIMAFKKAYVALNPEPVTKAEQIRAMDDEELAMLLYNWQRPNIYRKVEWIRCWLKKEGKFIFQTSDKPE